MLYLTFLKTVITVLLILLFFANSHAGGYDVGVYYFPGWHSKSEYWRDLKGEPGSLSSGKDWKERYPLLGFYPEEEVWVAEKHIEWASSYGIDFFAYDWYWDGKKPFLDHAINAYLKAKKKEKLKFCIMWANHSEVPRNIEEFNNLVIFWIEHYFKNPNYFFVNDKPLVFVFSPTLLHLNAKKFKDTAGGLIAKANKIAKEKGFREIFFVAISNESPDSFWVKRFSEQGFSAHTGWNYVMGNKELRLDYDAMVNTYLEFYEASQKMNKILPYIIPASPGHDSSPWHGEKAFVRENSTPDKFERMLEAAKNLALKQVNGRKIIMIESWNEFAEGSYIEPTTKWGLKYLESLKRTLKP